MEEPGIAHISIVNVLASYYWNCWHWFFQFNSVSEVVKIISNNIVIMPNSYCLHFTSSCACKSTSFGHNAKNKIKLQCSSCSHSSWRGEHIWQFVLTQLHLFNWGDLIPSYYKWQWSLSVLKSRQKMKQDKISYIIKSSNNQYQ